MKKKRATGLVPSGSVVLVCDETKAQFQAFLLLIPASTTRLRVYEIVKEDLSYPSHLLPTTAFVVAVPLEFHFTICTTFFDVHLLGSSAWVAFSPTSATASETLSSFEAAKRGPLEVDVVLKYFSNSKAILCSVCAARGREGKNLQWLACTNEKRSGPETKAGTRGVHFTYRTITVLLVPWFRTTVTFYDTSWIAKDCFYETQPWSVTILEIWNQYKIGGQCANDAALLLRLLL